MTFMEIRPDHLQFRSEWNRRDNGEEGIHDSPGRMRRIEEHRDEDTLAAVEKFAHGG